MTTTSAPLPVGDRPVDAPGTRFGAACDADARDSSVRRMRSFVSHAVRRLDLPEDVRDTARLVVSELVTNAVLHSGSHSVTVLVGMGPGRLLITVRDHGRWRDRGGTRHSAGDADASCGRGLDLVRALTERCTVVSGPDGTVVAAEVRLAPRTRVPDAAGAFR
ncbi:ATP-binding protein [Streptomyces sp. C10-9-1]|uniref:ATP-binding protein n=1 Tax=Streptomyces sp. C10-9-1 TaxID=1859285 RepID=UPI003D760A00